ncbi:MAG: hypothetical protein ACRC5H_02065 [Treponemataceae bacterium]
MTKKVYLKYFFIFLIFPLVAQTKFSVPVGAQKIIKTTSPIYDALTAVAFDAGETTFASSGPLTAGEIKRYLDDLPYEKLSRAGKYHYDWIVSELQMDYFGFSSGIIGFGIDPSIAIEGFVKSNPDIEWLYTFRERNYPLLLPVLFSVSDFVTLESDIAVGQYQSVMNEHDNYTNIPAGTIDLNGNFPHFAYISSGAQTQKGSFFNFQLGYGAMNIGRSEMGSVIMSDYMNDITTSRLSFFSPRIKYSAYVNQLETNKYFYLHHVEFRPLKWFNIAIVEGVLVNAPFEFRYLNPIMAFHGFGAWASYGDYNDDIGSDYPAEDSRVTSYFAVTFDVNPWRFIRLYGLFTMNQFQMQYEIDHNPEAAKIPNGIGWQAGIEGWIPINNGYLRLNGEFLHTDPYLYIAKNPKWSLIADKKELYINTTEALRAWVGTPFGPDTIAFQLTAIYSLPRIWTAGLKYRLKIHGEINKTILNSVGSDGKPNYYPTSKDEAQRKTPTGTPEYENLVSVQGSYEIYDGITIFAQVGFVHHINHDNRIGNTQMGFEGAISVKMNLFDFAKIFIKPKE